MSKQLEEFYIQNRAKLVNRLKYQAGSPENAEDVLQESFARALKYWNCYNPNTHALGTWFGTIMNNTLRVFKRNERSMGTYVELEEDNAGTYEMSETDSDMAKRIVKKIESFSGDHKTVLYLYFLKEYKPREICDVVEMKYKNIQTVIQRFKHEMNYKFGD